MKMDSTTQIDLLQYLFKIILVYSVTMHLTCSLLQLIITLDYK